MEDCVLGVKNETRICHLEKAVIEIKESVTKLTNHYSNRLPGWATIMITILGSAVVGLGVYFLTRGS